MVVRRTDLLFLSREKSRQGHRLCFVRYRSHHGAGVQSLPYSDSRSEGRLDRTTLTEEKMQNLILQKSFHALILAPKTPVNSRVCDSRSSRSLPCLQRLCIVFFEHQLTRANFFNVPCTKRKILDSNIINVDLLVRLAVPVLVEFDIVIHALVTIGVCLVDLRGLG